MTECFLQKNPSKFKLMITNRSVSQSNFIERTVPSVHYRLLALLPKREWKMGSILRAHSAFGLSQFHDELWQHLEHATTTWTVNYHSHRIKVSILIESMPCGLYWNYSDKICKNWENVYTLASGIDVGPTFINFGFFSRPYGLIREYINVI